MFTEITKDNNYPKTLVIRNHEGGAIWQVYHMDNKYQVDDIVQGATKNGFDAITLEDYQEEYEETFPHWRADVVAGCLAKFPDYLIRKEDVHYPYKESLTEADYWDGDASYSE